MRRSVPRTPAKARQPILPGLRTSLGLPMCLRLRIILGLPTILGLLVLLGLAPAERASGQAGPGDVTEPDGATEPGPPTPRRLLRAASPPPANAGSTAVLVARGLVSPLVAEGGELFFRETFGGNGRACGTCHRVEANLTIDRELVASLPPGDPLFLAETDPELAELERPALLRSHGLILENLDGFDDPNRRFVMRGIPHLLSLATSTDPPPEDGRPAVERTGWSGDGAPGEGALRSFARAAIFQHLPRTLARREGTDFRFPTEAELDALEAYMLATGRLADTRLAPMVFRDPGAARGREIFLGRGLCFECHSRAGANSDFGGNRNFRTGIEDIPHPARQLEDFPPDGGFGTAAAPCAADPGAACFGDGTFNTPSLVEVADTPPFFHNNLFDTLEEAVAFYGGAEFNASPAAEEIGNIDLSEQDAEDVADLLRVLNAGFNIALSRQRTEAARALEPAGLRPQTTGPVLGRPKRIARRTADRLLELANEELEDAVRVLGQGDLHPEVVALLDTAMSLNSRVAETPAAGDRRVLLDESLATQDAAGPLLGQGIVFLLGEGNLVF